MYEILFCFYLIDRNIFWIYLSVIIKLYTAAVSVVPFPTTTTPVTSITTSITSNIPYLFPVFKAKLDIHPVYDICFISEIVTE